MPGIDTSDNYVFEYDDTVSASTNFNHWYAINCEERSAYGESLHTLDEAKKVFQNIYVVQL